MTRVAVIGNSFAARVQLPALRHVGNNEVVGIAGRQRAKAEQTARDWGIPVATDDYRELLSLDPDLVLVSTPVPLHHRMVLDVVEQSRAAILCEKPFGLTVAEAEQMAEAARGRLALIDHQLRYNPVRAWLREQIWGGRIGQVWQVDADFGFDSRRSRDRPFDWWFEAESGGGALMALGSHWIDTLSYELGPVDSVRCELHRHLHRRADEQGTLWPVTADTSAGLWLRMASGAHVNLRTATVAGTNRMTSRYTGSDGVLEVRGEAEVWGAKPGEELERLEHPALPTAAEQDMPDYGPFARSLPLYLRAVLGAVRAGKTFLPHACSFHDALPTQRVLDAAREDAKGPFIPVR